MKINLSSFGQFFLKPRNLFFLGLAVVFGLTFSEVIRGRQCNFFIYAESTKLFWQGIAPYGTNWTSAVPELDYYLYGPLFNILFAPFAYLPGWLGPFAWNIFNFIFWFTAIFSMPERFSQKEKCISFLYTLPILACTQLSMQYNVAVGYIWLFAYILLERGKGFPAVLLIMISGFTKIYGIAALAMLLFYPKFWRNIGYAVLIAAVFLLAPAVSVSFSGMGDFYNCWFGALGDHPDTREWANLLYLRPLNLHQYRLYVQIGVLLALAAGVFSNIRRWKDELFKMGCLAILMAYTILFSNSSETHTYTITLIGYMFWYWNMVHYGYRTLFDRILFWAILIVVVLMPLDVLCPVPVMEFFYGFQLNLWLLLVMFLRECQVTFLIRKGTA